MQEVTIAPGQTLWDALADHGIQLNRPCGGRGICGGCKVCVEGLGDVLACRFDRPGIYRVEPGVQVAYDVVMNSGAANSGAANSGAANPGRTNPRAANPGGVNSGGANFRESTSGKTASESQSEREVYIAVDIGTTTVALSGVCGKRMVREGFLNPQRSFGADVVSRIAAANAGQGAELCAMLMEQLMEALERMRARLNRDCMHCMVGIAANTTMLHILRGFSCEGLGRAPFAPVDLKEGHDVWKGTRAEYEICYMPGISAYVGADIVSGIYGLKMTERQEVTMLLDLGTNGEMAIGNSGRLLCASAAAGPAFEGSPLALQIQASGILKCIHKLRQCGMIDEYGLLDEDYFGSGYPVEPLLEADAADSEELKNLRITQDNIREIQMAKGAIRAGIEVLLKEYGVDAWEVSRVYLAGGMGYYIDPADAVGIGLLPEAFAGKTEAVGNSCLTGLLRAGARMDSKPKRMNCPDEEDGCLQGKATWRKIADFAEEIVLAEHADFEELYIEAMNFPAL